MRFSCFLPVPGVYSDRYCQINGLTRCLPVFPPIPFLLDSGCSEAMAQRTLSLTGTRKIGVRAQVRDLYLFCVQGKWLSM